MTDQAVATEPQRVLVRALREIAAERGIAMHTFSQDWIVRLERGGQVRHVFGFNFELNSAAAQLIANDKAAVSDLLGHAGVERVEHRLFNHPRSGSYAAPQGNWTDLYAFAAACGWDVVAKSNTGTGGWDVVRCRGPRSLELAVHELFEKERSICLSPWCRIDEEYRVVMVQGACELAYRKVRPAVTGDGSSTVLELLLAGVAAARWGQKLVARVAQEAPDLLEQAPPAGVEQPLLWRHNLGQGARPEAIEGAELPGRLVSLARRATDALHVELASVDIVQTDGELRVLELNSGIMMESYAQLAPGGYDLAKAVYAKVIDRMF